MSDQLYRQSGVLWSPSGYTAYCPKHRLEMDSYTRSDTKPAKYDLLRCEECPDMYQIPRDFSAEGEYLRRRLKSKNLKNAKVLNLDDEAIPIAEDDVRTKDGKYFVKALLTESKIGQRLVIYAGEKGKKDKAQIFVEPSIERLSFDQTNIHPLEIFARVDATFKSGKSHSMKNAKPKKKSRAET